MTAPKEDCRIHRWEDIGFGKCLTHDEVFLLPDGGCARRDEEGQESLSICQLRGRVSREIARCEERLEMRLGGISSKEHLRGRIAAYKIVLSLLPKDQS